MSTQSRKPAFVHLSPPSGPRSEAMLPELYRSFETGTLLDLVSYGDPDDEEPEAEEPIHQEDGAPAHPEVLARRRRGWLLLGGKKGRWLRLGRRWIDRAVRR